jgi:hypothetical protein
VSLSLLVGLVGSMARNDRPASAVPSAGQPASAAPTTGPSSVQVPAPVQVTAPTTPPVTTSHAT